MVIKGYDDPSHSVPGCLLSEKRCKSLSPYDFVVKQVKVNGSLPLLYPRGSTVMDGIQKKGK